MPEIDGREAAREIRLLEGQHPDGPRPRVPIVALTAHAMDGDEASILAAGIDRYMTKPLRKSAIAEVIGACRPPKAGPVAGSDVVLADATLPRATLPDVAPMDAT